MGIGCTQGKSFRDFSPSRFKLLLLGRKKNFSQKAKHLKQKGRKKVGKEVMIFGDKPTNLNLMYNEEEGRRREKIKVIFVGQIDILIF